MRRAQDHDRTGESDGDGGTDNELHGRGEWYSTAELPVAQERGEHQRGDRSELHDAGNKHVGKRIEVPVVVKNTQDGDQCGGDADGECGRGQDHDLTGESDGGGGQTATFTVVASGTAPLNYQWHKNGVNISGATGASYTTPATTTAESGSRFAVVVKNTAGTVTSAAATLTVNAAAPRITTSPAYRRWPGTDSDLHGRGKWYSTAELPVAEKRGEHYGATAASYTTPVTTTAESGSRFPWW